MRIKEIINEKREQLKEFAIENNTGYTNEVVEQVLDAKAANQWSNGMTLEEMLKREGLQ